MCSARTEAKLSGRIPHVRPLGSSRLHWNQPHAVKLDELIVDGSVERANFCPLFFLAGPSNS